MRFQNQGDPCCVAGCYRRSKKEIPFCERCWATATDGEQAMVRFSMHAPFFGAYVKVTTADADPEVPVITERRRDNVPEGVWISALWGDAEHGFLMLGEDSMGRVLAEYEARTTREAVAATIADRRRRGVQPHQALEEDIAHVEG